MTHTKPGGTACCRPEMTSPSGPLTGWGIFQPWPVQPVWSPFPTRPTLFVSLLFWACLPCKEEKEGQARVPIAGDSHGTLWCMQPDALGSNPILLPISYLTWSNHCLILLLSSRLCNVGVALVSTLCGCDRAMERICLPHVLCLGSTNTPIIESIPSAFI